jgi:predicted Zn finger-like uncharacterized protein
MLIDCPSCGTSYEVESAGLSPTGRRVRCGRCRTVWRAGPLRADLLVAAATALAPEHRSEIGAVPLAAAAEVFRAEAPVLALNDAEWADDAPNVQPSEAEAAGTAAENLDLEMAESGPASASADRGHMEAAESPSFPANDRGPPPIEIDARPEMAEAGSHHEDIETYAARQAQRDARSRKWRWPMSRLQPAILALALIDAALVGWRVQVVRVLPQTAPFYALIGLPVNLRGLVFDGVSTSTTMHDGAPILIVQGEIVNAVGATSAVPRLKLAVRNAAKQIIYSWTVDAPRKTLPAGQAVAFHIKLTSPPRDSRDVLVRFVTRHDRVADAR